VLSIRPGAELPARRGQHRKETGGHHLAWLTFGKGAAPTAGVLKHAHVKSSGASTPMKLKRGSTVALNLFLGRGTGPGGIGSKQERASKTERRKEGAKVHSSNAIKGFRARKKERGGLQTMKTRFEIAG